MEHSVLWQKKLGEWNETSGWESISGDDPLWPRWWKRNIDPYSFLRTLCPRDRAGKFHFTPQEKNHKAKKMQSTSEKQDYFLHRYSITRYRSPDYPMTGKVRFQNNCSWCNHNICTVIFENIAPQDGDRSDRSPGFLVPYYPALTEDFNENPLHPTVINFPENASDSIFMSKSQQRFLSNASAVFYNKFFIYREITHLFESFYMW